MFNSRKYSKDMSKNRNGGNGRGLIRESWDEAEGTSFLRPWDEMLLDVLKPLLGMIGLRVLSVDEELCS
jgi:hypothetical protein